MRTVVPKKKNEVFFKTFRVNLLVVNSVNYYFDRLTADVYEGNITYDVFNYISHIIYNTIFIFNNISNYEKVQ